MRIALAASICLAPLMPAAAFAIEIGDVFSLSSNGVGQTVTALRRTNNGSIEITSKTMEANAAEYCERYEELKSDTKKYSKCIKENVDSSPSVLTVNCRSATIILTGRGGGSYRRDPGGGPWVSVANPNWIVQGDDVYRLACGRRS